MLSGRKLRRDNSLQPAKNHFPDQQSVASELPVITGQQDAPVLDYLEKVLASKSFHKSDFLKQLLRYLVVKVIRSEEHQIKEYSLATEVFGRKESFDSRSDTIVRVQARRLRLKLERYYNMEGRHDPVRF